MAGRGKNRGFTGFILMAVLILTTIFLFSTNPDEDQFKLYIQHEITKEAREQGGIWGGMLEVFSGAGAWSITRYTTRENYYLFSVYTVEITDEKERFLGIGNTFFEL